MTSLTRAVAPVAMLLAWAGPALADVAPDRPGDTEIGLGLIGLAILVVGAVGGLIWLVRRRRA